MAFNPKYTITSLLLANIKKIDTLVGDLNNKHFSKTVVYELERWAREVSSYASTSIEGNPLPLTEVKKVLKFTPQNIRESEQEVINYNAALKKLNQKCGITMSLGLILDIHWQVMNKLLPVYQLGRIRKEPVIVNNPRIGQVIYLPPDARDVEFLLNNLISFTKNNQGKIDPLIIAGIFHKQFEVIHPFIDGNGRTGRLATKVLLASMGLDTFNLFSFENYYNQNVTGYFQSVGVLGNYYEIAGAIDFTGWLEYFTGGIIDELLRVQKILATKGFNPKTELMPYHNKILDFIKEKGFITGKDYSMLTNRAKATRALDFQKLIKLGLITKKGNGRATYYQLKN